MSSVVGVGLAEHTFTHMLRNSGEVLAEVEHRDVVLRRRDGEDLFLGLRSREASVRDALGVLARLLLAASVDADTRRKVAGALAASLPWTTFLPDDEREEFFDALDLDGSRLRRARHLRPAGPSHRGLARRRPRSTPLPAWRSS